MPDPIRPGLFLIGKIDKRGRQMVFVTEPAPAPFPGPWDLRAVVTIG